MTQLISDYEETEVETDETDCDVVIVGAGLTGLTAANRLVSAGLNVIILEQNEFIGGRLITCDASRCYYAHESQHCLQRMIEYLQLLKIHEGFSMIRKILHIERNEILNNNIPFYVAAEVYYFIKTMDEISKDSRFKNVVTARFGKEFSYKSVEDVLGKLVFFKKSRFICRNLIYMTCGITSLDQISALWYFTMLNGANGFLQRLKSDLGDSERYFIKEGAISMAKLLSKNVIKDNQIRFKQRVSKIEFNDDRSHVWTQNSHYRCDYVISAVPPSVYSKIEFGPQLPPSMEKLCSSFKKGENIFFNALSAEIHEFNIFNKTIIEVNKDKARLKCAYRSLDEDKLFRICGFLRESHDESSFAHSDITSTINKHFDCNVLEFEEYRVCESLNLGGSPMDVPMPDDARLHVNWLHENHGRIFFAASEFANNWPGTVDGAIEAGESVACSVLERMRPQSLDRFELALYRSRNTANFKDETNFGLIVTHKICFLINFFVALSCLRTAFISLRAT